MGRRITGHLGLTASRQALAAGLALFAAAGGFAQAREPSAEQQSADAPASKARGPVPKDITVWAGQIQQNYPKGVLNAGQQATVMVRATVDPAGKVTDCAIVTSSGFTVLDHAACDAMRRFALFTPALDDAGKPTTGTWATRITYKDSSSLPIDPASPSPTTV